jgi:ankyrin repeat protein
MRLKELAANVVNSLKIQLVESIEKGDIHIVDELISKAPWLKDIKLYIPNVNKEDREFFPFDMLDGTESILHLAARNEQLEIIRSLIVNHSMDPNIKNDYNETPLHAAIEENKLLSANALIDNGADVNIHLSKKEVPVIPNADNLNDTVEVDPHQDSMDDEPATSPLHYNEQDNSPSTKTIYTYDLLNGEPVLNKAIKLGYIDIVNLLLASGAEAGYLSDSSNQTVLHLAATLGHHDIINSIAFVEPNLVSEVDFEGWTPLHRAAQLCNAKAAQALINNGADINARLSDSSESPLHLAARRKDVEMIDTLSKADGFDINAKDFQGRTALHIAAQIGDIRTVMCLTRKGAQNLHDDDGKTPYNYANDNGYHDIVEYFDERKSNLAAIKSRQTKIQALQKRNQELTGIIHKELNESIKFKEIAEEESKKRKRELEEKDAEIQALKKQLLELKENKHKLPSGNFVITSSQGRRDANPIPSTLKNITVNTLSLAGTKENITDINKMINPDYSPNKGKQTRAYTGVSTHRR